MNTALDCVPCILRHTIQAARVASSSRARQESLVREALQFLASSDLGGAPPAAVQGIHRLIRLNTGLADPYLDAKRLLNRVAMDLLPTMTERVEEAKDRFFMAVRYAIAGNVIDLGIYDSVTTEDLRAAMDQVTQEPFVGDVEALRRAVDAADSILYLADNAGEIVFDGLLIQRLPPGKVTVAVRGGPIINDATLADAREAGLHRLAPLVDNGSDAPGTLLPDCSAEFRRLFREADLILAKGQGNFETLCDEDAPLFFLFKVKCAVAARRASLPVGTHALLGGLR